MGTFHDYNLLVILEYLFSGQESSLILGHEKLLERFKEHLLEKKIVFDKRIFNACFKCEKIIRLKTSLGTNIKVVNKDNKEMLIQLLKKLVAYKTQEFKRKEKIKNFRSKKDREKRDRFLSKNINISEYFYLYRIKANYRDLEFLDKDIKEAEFCDFYKNYFGFTKNFYSAIRNLINDLSKVRLGKKIL